MTIPPEKILERVAASGYDTELKVASIVSDEGWFIQQNLYYVDKDEQKGRELDLSAYMNFRSTEERPECIVAMHLSIEIKKTSEPFIFLSSPKRRYVEEMVAFGAIHTSQNVDNLLLNYRAVDRQRPMRDSVRLARSYLGFKKDAESNIRSALLSALKGAVHLKDADGAYSDTSRDICFCLPIVAVEGSIYECYFEPGSAKMIAEEVQRIEYVQNYDSPAYGRLSSRVIVVTIDALPDLLIEYQSWGRDMLETMVKNRHNRALK